jgi:tRNA-intron endonuclease
MDLKELIKKADQDSYIIFRDLKGKGHIIKEGLKFGADFRVYEKNEKPGKNHAKYLIYALNGNKKIDLKIFSSKARIAHSTNKILLLAIVDSEEDVTYYETSWKNI